MPYNSKKVKKQYFISDPKSHFSIEDLKNSFCLFLELKKCYFSMSGIIHFTFIGDCVA